MAASVCDRRAEVRYGQAGDICVHQAAGVRMGKSLDGDFVDALDHPVGTRAYCIGHTLGLQRLAPDVLRQSKRARCTILGARETSDRDVAEISFFCLPQSNQRTGFMRQIERAAIKSPLLIRREPDQ